MAAVTATGVGSAATGGRARDVVALARIRGGDVVTKAGQGVAGERVATVFHQVAATAIGRGVIPLQRVIHAEPPDGHIVFVGQVVERGRSIVAKRFPGDPFKAPFGVFVRGADPAVIKIGPMRFMNLLKGKFPLGVTGKGRQVPVLSVEDPCRGQVTRLVPGDLIAIVHQLIPVAVLPSNEPPLKVSETPNPICMFPVAVLLLTVPPEKVVNPNPLLLLSVAVLLLMVPPLKSKIAKPDSIFEFDALPLVVPPVKV